MTLAQAETALHQAALAWWAEFCPTTWTPWAHAQCPTLNCVTQAERDLATACAALLAAREEAPCPTGTP